MVEDAKFWVVEPRVTLSGVSGLGTLLSGNYIGFEVGKSDKAQRTVHRARGAADHHRRSAGPAVRPQGGQASARWGSARRFTTADCWRGRSSRTASRPTARRSRSRSSSTRPTTNTCNAGTRFWNASGIDASIGAGGVEVRTQSIVVAARRRPRVRDADLRRQGRARRRGRGLHALRRPSHRDEAARVDLGALRALLQRIAARALRRRAGHSSWAAGGRSHRCRLRHRPGDDESARAGGDRVLP